MEDMWGWEHLAWLPKPHDTGLILPLMIFHDLDFWEDIFVFIA
jgi:hypothetical protein